MENSLPSDYAKYVYELELLSSPLFHITSKKRLAILLHSSVKELNNIVRSKDQMYQYFNETQTDNNGNIIKVRPIQNPNDRLKQIHSRIGKFLGNLKAPEYLHSKRSKSS
ncbi:TPA: RNA-directed DNA polymerase, partial [Acinetobacter baumannii]|nr:RNA-directed DNA polymerase [Acinetobacter baumannii]